MTQSGKPTSPLKAAIVQVTPFQQNCTLLWDDATKAGAVVDPGGDLDVIERAIAETGMKVEKILLTHGHIDHAGGADELRERLGVNIEGPHKADIILLEALEKQAKLYQIPDVRNVTPDRWLEEGDTVDLAGHTFEIFHCPGHSPALSCFSTARSGSRSSATSCFRDRSGARIFPTAITTRSSTPSRRSYFRWATTWPSFAVTAVPVRSASSARAIRFSFEARRRVRRD